VCSLRRVLESHRALRSSAAVPSPKPRGLNYWARSVIVPPARGPPSDLHWGSSKPIARNVRYALIVSTPGEPRNMLGVDV
jgi:hypothetical protein